MSNATRRNWIWKGLLSLVVLALVAFTLQALVFSGASFTARSVSPTNVFVSGSLTHTNDKSGKLTIDASGLTPGASSTGTVSLTNGGDVPGRFGLYGGTLVNTPSSPKLSDALTLKVEDVTGTPATVYQGAVAAFTTASLGEIAPGAARTYRLTLSWPAGNNVAALQGATMTLSLTITGVSL